MLKNLAACLQIVWAIISSRNDFAKMGKQNLEQYIQEESSRPNLKEIKKTENPIGKLIDVYIDLKHGTDRKNYLKRERETIKQDKLSVDTANSWFSGQYRFPLKHLKIFVDELQVPLEEVIAVNNGKDPFKPDIEEFKKTKNPIGKLVDFYIDLIYNLDKKNYLKKESKTVKREKLNASTTYDWFKGINHFPLKYFKGFVDELQIPLEEVIAVNKGKDPFKADLEEIKRAKNSFGRLIDFYIDLNYGISRDNYLRQYWKTIEREKFNIGTARSWFQCNHPFPPKYLKRFVDELQIPIEEVIAINKGKDPFKVDIEEIKKAKNAIGKLIDVYINVRYNLDRKNYLEKESEIVKNEKLNINTAFGWFSGQYRFPLKHLKIFVDELQIPLEEVIAVNKGKNPFKADLEEIKKSENPIGKLIDFYIDLNYGISRDNYLRKENEKVKQEKFNKNTTYSWFSGDNPFPLKYLKSFVDELQVPLEEVITVNNGKDPFKPDIEEFKKTKNPIGRLIYFYIDLNHGMDRENYLRKGSETVKHWKLNTNTANNWFISDHPFPLKYLKGFVDELQIPYKEINYLIEGDIEKGIGQKLVSSSTNNMKQVLDGMLNDYIK